MVMGLCTCMHKEETYLNLESFPFFNTTKCVYKYNHLPVFTNEMINSTAGFPHKSAMIGHLLICVGFFFPFLSMSVSDKN